MLVRVQQRTDCGRCGVQPERAGRIKPRMKRLVVEIGMGIARIIAGLEAVHYRSAVVAANIDLNRAWKTVVELREKCHGPLNAGP